MLDNKIWVVIPAWNEEKNIGRVLGELKKFTSNILVVDDGSRDRTKEICREQNVICISHRINRGQGASLETGQEAALRLGAEIIVHFDSDGQMKPEEIEKVVAPIFLGEADITLGSRFLDDKTKIPWTKRYFILIPAKIFNWVFTGIWLTDAHCGFRALSRQAAEAISLKQDAFAHATEILEQIYEHKLRYKEIPVEISYYRYGLGFKMGIKIIKDLILRRLLS